jgi:hypothetical protein
MESGWHGETIASASVARKRQRRVAELALAVLTDTERLGLYDAAPEDVRAAVNAARNKPKGNQDSIHPVCPTEPIWPQRLGRLTRQFRLKCRK